jgi:hypothetical protein
VSPAVLESDSGADVSQGQVVVEDLPAERNSDDVPRYETTTENQEPTDTDRPQIVEPRPRDGLAPLS